MTYEMTFLRRTAGTSLTPLELRGGADLGIAETMFAQPDRLRSWCAARHIRFGNDLHMTADASCFKSAGAGDLLLHEGKTFHQYTDVWNTTPRYSVMAAAVKPTIVEAARQYRLVFRDIARSNDERTMIACVAPPGVVFGHTATVEKSPWGRSVGDVLVLCALFNSFSFDWLVRQKAATHLSLYILHPLPVPSFSDGERRFLAHAALRLSCNHAGYDPLWHGLANGAVEPAGWALRADVDAAIARSYGLNRDQYRHLLESFNHRSGPDTKALCLEAFDRRQVDADRSNSNTLSI
jgi:hypothetical protein